MRSTTAATIGWACAAGDGGSRGAPRRTTGDQDLLVDPGQAVTTVAEAEVSCPGLVTPQDGADHPSGAAGERGILLSSGGGPG
jgi:hypothetical protein